MNTENEHNDLPGALDADSIVTFIGGIFERRGAEEYLGEEVTMAEHMYQSAQFAEQAHETEEVIVAALLHDIGHFTSEFGSYSSADTADKWHEEAGATVLEPFFPAAIVDCVRHHVAAKRYLCAVDADYLGKLSAASVHSLKLQGGPMTDAEVVEFGRHPNLQDIVRVRRYDDRAKVADLTTPKWSHYAPMVQRIVKHYRSHSTIN